MALFVQLQFRLSDRPRGAIDLPAGGHTGHDRVSGSSKALWLLGVTGITSISSEQLRFGCGELLVAEQTFRLHLRELFKLPCKVIPR